jgi:hypothetical protein
MILKDGKFYENGKEVRAEAGNVEQIKLMAQHQANAAKLASIERLRSSIKEAFSQFKSLSGQI